MITDKVIQENAIATGLNMSVLIEVIENSQNGPIF